MPKPIALVGVSIVADSMVPGKGNLLSIGSTGLNHDFQINIQPPNGHVRPKFLDKYPSLWEQIQVDPVPPKEALKKYIHWLQSLKASTIGVGENWAFWWIYHTSMETVGRCPFENKMVDVWSYLQGKKNQKVQKFRKIKSIWEDSPPPEPIEDPQINNENIWFKTKTHKFSVSPLEMAKIYLDIYKNMSESKKLEVQPNITTKLLKKKIPPLNLTRETPTYDTWIRNEGIYPIQPQPLTYQLLPLNLGLNNIITEQLGGAYTYHTNNLQRGV